jgi:hypothetical protein
MARQIDFYQLDHRSNEVIGEHEFVDITALIGNLGESRFVRLIPE